MMSINWKKHILIGCSLTLIAGILWYLRSWNLQIGDGEFCCKQIAGGDEFPITLSRCPLSLVLYRSVFFTLHQYYDWWVEDCIAICSCTAGVFFFGSLFYYASACCKSWFQFLVVIFFPSSTLLLQIFCGHIEFYSWTCAMLMLTVHLAWLSLHKGLSPLWPSLTMALAAGFHSSGVFYFPCLLLLPSLIQNDKPTVWPHSQHWEKIAIVFALFIFTVLFHRKPFLYIFLIICIVPAYFFYLPAQWKSYLSAYWPVFLPWFFLFTIRAAFGLRAEPLIEHLHPLVEPYTHDLYSHWVARGILGIWIQPLLDYTKPLTEIYDHGAFHYAFWSWDHLYFKALYHWWLAPFGFIVFAAATFRFRSILVKDRWAFFLYTFALWGLIWSTLFYAQLEKRDWDLFASITIPLNLFAVYVLCKPWPSRWFRFLLSCMILVQLCISIPIIWKNSSIGVDRGYVSVTYNPTPVECRAFLRELPLLGTTPITQTNVRAGQAKIRMVPQKRGHASWEKDIRLIPGRDFTFDPLLEKVDVPPIPGTP